MTSTPTPIDLLIEARWIAPVATDNLLEHHAVAIDQGRIVALLPTSEARQRFRPNTRRTLEQHLLIPGLINLHTHAAMSLLRGIADDLPLMEWLQKHIWPAEAAHMSAQFVLDGTRLACAEMLRGGITCFNDMYFYPDASARAASEFGMRATIGITTLEFPTPYASDADDYLHKGLTVRERWLDQPLINFSLAPHAPYTVSDNSFTRIVTLAEQLNLPIHCHLHETRQEIADSLNNHGLRPLARLHRLGLTGPGLTAVHAVHLEPEEIALLAESGSHVAHCPSSNLKLASGIAPLKALIVAGVNVGLGTDGAASNNRLDLFSEMRLASLLAKGSSGDASAVPAHCALRMATLNAAQALGLSERIGSIAPGKDADLCAIDLSPSEYQPCFDPVAHLIHVAGREAVSDVWIAGKCCVENKTLRTNSPNNLEAALTLWQNRLEVCR